PGGGDEPQLLLVRLGDRPGPGDSGRSRHRPPQDALHRLTAPGRIDPGAAGGVVLHFPPCPAPSLTSSCWPPASLPAPSSPVRASPPPSSAGTTNRRSAGRCSATSPAS